MNAEEAFEAMATAPDPPPVESAAQNVEPSVSFVELIRASDIVPEPITWLWNGWLAAGKFHILGGAPGTGKTTLALALAAVVTRASMWPDGTYCSEVGNVLVWSGEDDPKDTLVPRLHAAKADVDRVYFIGEVREPGEDCRPFRPAMDLQKLEAALQRIGGARLLVVDPVVAAVSGDSHKNAEVRNDLQPLVDLGRRFGCAVLGITHFSKGTGGREPTERLTGSLAFGALARVVLVAVKSQKVEEDGPQRIFARSKSNIGSDTGGFGYDVCQGPLAAYPEIETSWIHWGPALEGSARDLLCVAEAPKEDGLSGAIDDAKTFLQEELADGPVAPAEIKKHSTEAGISGATLRRAQDELGIKPKTKDGIRYAWFLPEQVHPAHVDHTPETGQHEQDGS